MGSAERMQDLKEGIVWVHLEPRGRTPMVDIKKATEKIRWSKAAATRLAVHAPPYPSGLVSGRTQSGL